MSTSNRCAACKCLRRRCPEDCILAPYFPSSHPQRFSCVHRIYGASNVTKMLQQVPPHLRAQAADSLSIEANLRMQDPVYGCVGIISQLQHEIHMSQYELARTKAQIAFYTLHKEAEPSQAQLQLGPPNQEMNTSQLEPTRTQDQFAFPRAGPSAQMARAQAQQTSHRGMGKTQFGIGRSQAQTASESQPSAMARSQAQQGEASGSGNGSQPDPMLKLDQLLLDILSNT